MSAKTRVPPQPPKPQQPVRAKAAAVAAPKPAEAAAPAPRRRRGLPIRLLPVTIFVAVLMLGMRLGDVWQGVMHGRVPDAGSPLQAQQANGRPPVAASSVRMAENPPQPAPPAPPPVPLSGEADTGRPLALGKEQRVSQSDVELLQQLAQRRDDLERRGKELERREALLVAAEQRFDQKVAELEKLRQEIQGLLRTVDEKQVAQLESLVKIYETMKPKEAARIFEAMDLPVLMDVMERMKESKMAPILASMDPMKAKEVTIALVDRRQLPQLPTQ